MSDEGQVNGFVAPPMPNPFENPELFKAFAFVIDGEVAIHQLYLISLELEGTIAALSSDPKVVEIPIDIFIGSGNGGIGMRYADGVFSPAVV